MSTGDEQIPLLGEDPQPEPVPAPPAEAGVEPPALDAPFEGDGGEGEDPPEAPWLEWGGDDIDFSEAMLDRGHAYGSYVNTSRAIPDVRDGLKPVQRRILFAMDELGLRSDRPYRKSATTVGHVVGHYHPHGDAPVYDAMVRMAQDFQSSTPMVDGQGNWGNVDGDPAAAMRYTEARLTDIATESMADLRPEVVAYRDNFSETKQEATVLPVTAPLLLTLGVSGIGWSMACDIPPHNVGEALAAAIIVAKSANAGLARVMAAMPAPDFPGGGIIASTDALERIYETGQGTIQLQARYLIEDLPGGQQAVLVTELPYQVGPDQIVRQVVQAARDGKITEVVEMPRNLTGRDTGPRVQIKCKRGGSVQKLVADLMRYTSLRSTVKFNLTVLADGKPRVLGLMEILRRFAAFRNEVITKRLEHERAVLWRDLHRLLGLMAAVGAIDEVVQIIRESEDDDDAKAKLIAALTYVPHGARNAVPIDEQQATWIIEMQLRRLNRLNRFRLQDEVKAKGARIDEIAETLASENGVRDIVVRELEEARSRHAVPRRTGIQTAPAAGTLEGSAAEAASPTAAPGSAIGDVTMTGGPVAVYAGDLGQIMVCDPNMRRIPRVPLQVASGAAVIAAIDLPAPRPLIAVTASGFAFKVNPFDAMPETRRSRGRQVVSMERGDRVVAVLPDDASATHAALVTVGGQIKRVEWAMLQAAHAAGVVCFKLPGGDRLAALVPHGEQDEILIATLHGRVLRTGLGAIRPVQTGPAGGVAGMSLAKGDRVVSAVRVEHDDLVTLHTSGFAKRTALEEYPAKGRGTGGVASAATDKPTRAPAGEVAFIRCLPREGDVALVTADGESVKVGASDLPPVARAAVSRPLVPMAEGDRPALLAALA